MLTQAQQSFMIDAILTEAWNQAPRATVHLFTNDYRPSALTTEDDLVEADFSGYTAFAPTTDYAHIVDAEDGLHAIVNEELATFQGDTGDGLPVNIYGYYWKAHDGTFIDAVRFPTPLTIFDATQVLRVVLSQKFLAEFGKN